MKTNDIVSTATPTDYRRLNSTITEARRILSRRFNRPVSRAEVLRKVELSVPASALPLTLADFRAALVRVFNA